MRVLVLGSSGVIGRALVSHLRREGHIVVEWDIRIHAKHDLSNPLNNPELDTVMSHCDFVFFLAFEVGGAKFITNPTVDFLNRNSLIMVNTFSVLQKQRKRFVFASSTMSNMGVPYGTMKLVGQHYTKLLSGISIRLWNVYGPEEHGERSHVITDFIHQLKSIGKIRMLSNGTEKRQFLHAEDCAECLDVIMQNYTAMPDVIDISSFEWVSIREVAEMVCADVSAPPAGVNSHTVQNEPNPHILKLWKPRKTLKEGIAELINRG